jgi:hypothetical protein
MVSPECKLLRCFTVRKPKVSVREIARNPSQLMTIFSKIKINNRTILRSMILFLKTSV